MVLIASFYIVYSLTNYSSCSYFKTIFFNLYTIDKWLTHLPITDLEFSKFDHMYIYLDQSVVCFHMFFMSLIHLFSLQLEALLSAFLPRQVAFVFTESLYSHPTPLHI